MSKIKRMNVKKILDLEDRDKIKDLIDYHINLKRRGVFDTNQQAKLIHQINRNIKKYLPDSDEHPDQKESILFYIQIMMLYLQNRLFDLEKLSDRNQNPLSDFIIDCEDTRFHTYRLGRLYVDRLMENGDNVILKELKELLDICVGVAFKLVSDDSY